MSDRKRAVGPVALAAALVAAAVALVIAAARGPSPPTTMDERVHAVAATLRCPVCQDLSVADSPSALAGEMRRTIERELRAGESPDEIRRGFVRAYGEWILQAPPKRGLDLVAWVTPLAFVGVALVAAVVALRRWTASRRPQRGGPEAAPLSVADRELLGRALAAPEDAP